MAELMIDAISNEISLLKFKLAKADGWQQRTLIKEQIKRKEALADDILFGIGLDVQEHKLKKIREKQRQF